MDRHCGDITVSLYLRSDGLRGEVQSYASRPGVPDRLAWIAAAMRTLGGMTGEGTTVAFACGAWHERAARRTFLEACKPDPAAALTARPSTVDDPRTNQVVSVTPLGSGAYRMTAVVADPNATSRAPAVAAGLAKLADVEVDPDDDTVVHFACGASHDELVSLLLPRAINVRAALREQELAASRGVLVAPSAQEAAS